MAVATGSKSSFSPAPWHNRGISGHFLSFLPPCISVGGLVRKTDATPAMQRNKRSNTGIKSWASRGQEGPFGRFRKAKLLFQPIVLAAGDPSEDARGLWGNSTPPPRAPTCLSVSRRGKQWPSPCSTCQISWSRSLTSRSQSGLCLRGAVRAVISKFYARRDREEGQRTGRALSTNELQRLRCV